MPIEAPSGTLDIENAKLRVSQFSATTGVGIGTENTQNYPLYIYKATEPELILQEGSVAAAKFTSNNGSLFIQSGATLSDNSDGDIVFSDMGVNTRHVTIKGATGNVGIGTANPACKLDITGEDVMIRGSTPSINFSESTNGMDGAFRIRYDGANQNDNNNFLAVQTGSNFGVSALHMTYGGNVGIGTTSPSYKLNVLTDTNYDGISLRDSTRELLKIAKGNNGAYINMFDSGVSKVNISTSGNSWLNGGNVGIGTENPAGEFHINGENMYFSSKVVFNCTWRILPQTGNATKLFRIYDEDNAADRLVIDASGNVGIGTVSPELDLHVYGAIITENNGAITPQIQFKSGANNTNGWLMRANVSDSYAGNFTIDRQDNSVTPNKFVIKNNGNVGIGTVQPSYPLSFAGAGFKVVTSVVNPMSTLGIGAFNFGELFVGDNVVTECICAYNPTAEGSYTYKCGYVQWIQMKVRGQGVTNTIQIIKSYSADGSTATITDTNSSSTLLTVTDGVPNISYTARVFYRALDTP